MTSGVAAARARAVALVLAAGHGRRFAAETGGDKLLVSLADGRSVLEHALAPFASLALPTLIVTTQARAAWLAARGRSNPHAGAEILALDAPSAGLGESLALGAREISRRYPQVEWLAVMLGDLPNLSATTVAMLLEHAADAPATVLALRATYRNQPGHPALFRHALWPELATLRGEHGARDLWAALPAASTILVTTLDAGVCADIDTRAELAVRQSG